METEQNDHGSNIYVDLLPTNVLKRLAPYIGSVNKYIDRLKAGYVYDMIFLIRYEAEKGEGSVIYDMGSISIKDVGKMSLY